MTKPEQDGSFYSWFRRLKDNSTLRFRVEACFLPRAPAKTLRACQKDPVRAVPGVATCCIPLNAVVVGLIL